MRISVADVGMESCKVLNKLWKCVFSFEESLEKDIKYEYVEDLKLHVFKHVQTIAVFTLSFHPIVSVSRVVKVLWLSTDVIADEELSCDEEVCDRDVEYVNPSLSKEEMEQMKLCEPKFWKIFLDEGEVVV